MLRLLDWFLIVFSIIHCVVHHLEISIVAIVDSGVNLLHHDLIDKLWVNSEEIAGNGIDDGNGTIDAIHGLTRLNRVV